MRRAGEFEARFTQFMRQLSGHLSFGGIRQQPLSIEEVMRANADFAYRYPDAAELLAEARAITRWHLLNKYQRQTIYLMRGIDQRLDIEQARTSLSPAWFPTSTTSSPAVAIRTFGGMRGTTYILEVDVNDVMYTYEISPEMRRRFLREQEYILRPGARPKVLDAAPAPELKMWYHGVERVPTEK